MWFLQYICILGCMYTQWWLSCTCGRWWGEMAIKQLLHMLSTYCTWKPHTCSLTATDKKNHEQANTSLMWNREKMNPGYFISLLILCMPHVWLDNFVLVFISCSPKLCKYCVTHQSLSSLQCCCVWEKSFLTDMLFSLTILRFKFFMIKRNTKRDAFNL